MWVSVQIECVMKGYCQWFCCGYYFFYLWDIDLVISIQYVGYQFGKVQILYYVNIVKYCGEFFFGVVEIVVVWVNDWMYWESNCFVG